jgi:hypothetical protein
MSQPALSVPPFEHPAYAFTAAALQNGNLAEASVRTCWSETVAFMQDLVRDNAAALEALSTCRTPVEVLAVEQNWLLARFESCVDAGLRLLLGAIREPESATAEAIAFRLPE